MAYIYRGFRVRKLTDATWLATRMEDAVEVRVSANTENQVKRFIDAQPDRPKRDGLPFLHVTQRVTTPLGPGTIIGFETYTKTDDVGPVVTEDPPNAEVFWRVEVELDDPTQWIPTPLTSHPFISRRQLSEYRA